MMKKLVSLVLCVFMLFACMMFAQAETYGNTNAVDIVLLIDQSGSMTQNKNPSDQDGMRLDAAQMVIAMLGRNGSRVAFVPFACRVYSNADTEFHEISSVDDYRTKMEQCESLRDSKNGPANENTGGTDFAEALAYAYNLLADRGPNENNQPMIILLTDGQIELQTSGTASGTGKTERYVDKPYYVWENNRFEFVQEYVNGVMMRANTLLAASVVN